MTNGESQYQFRPEIAVKISRSSAWTCLTIKEITCCASFSYGKPVVASFAIFSDIPQQNLLWLYAARTGVFPCRKRNSKHFAIISISLSHTKKYSRSKFRFSLLRKQEKSIFMRYQKSDITLKCFTITFNSFFFNILF